MKNQEEFRSNIIAVLSKCLKLDLDTVCSKVIAIHRTSLDIIFTDETDWRFSNVDDIYEHPIYDVTYVTALLDYNSTTGAFTINAAEVDSLVEDFFAEEFQIDIETIDNIASDVDNGEFTQEDLDYWYLNQRESEEYED
jgi:hypothetical protein